MFGKSILEVPFWKVLRQTAAAGFVVALLLVTLAHNFQHASQAVAVAPSQVEVGVSDDMPDTPNGYAGVVEHCHGCTLVGIAIAVAAVFPTEPVALPPAARINGLQPSTQPAETPPPISAI